MGRLDGRERTMIRSAQPQDAVQAVPLIYAAIGDIGNTLAGTHDDGEAIQVLQSFFQQRGNRLSYENTLVQEVNGRIVGVMISYHGARSSELDQPFADRIMHVRGVGQYVIAKEARDDEYYLDTLAVAQDAQGRGLGTALIHAFEAEASACGHRKLALLVEQANTRAFRLYQRLGYRVDGQLSVSGHMYSHMVKVISLDC